MNKAIDSYRSCTFDNVLNEPWDLKLPFRPRWRMTKSFGTFALSAPSVKDVCSFSTLSVEERISVTSKTFDLRKTSAASKAERIKRRINTADDTKSNTAQWFLAFAVPGNAFSCMQREVSRKWMNDRSSTFIISLRMLSKATRFTIFIECSYLYNPKHRFQEAGLSWQALRSCRWNSKVLRL